MFKCTFCIFQSRHFLCLLNHYEYKHSSKPGFKITCPHPVCGKDFRSVRCCQRHVRWFHSELYSELLCSQNIQRNPQTPTLAIPEEIHSGLSNADSDTAEEKIDFKKYLAQTLLNTREKCKVQSKALFSICDTIINVSTQAYSQSVNAVKKALNDSNIDIGNNELLKDALCDVSPLAISWESINSEKKLDKYVHENLSFVKPVEVVLGQNREIKECFQYIPALQTLQYLLQFKDIQAYVLNGHHSRNDILSDFCDGSVFNQHPLFSTSPDTLQLILYLDEVNFVNPLGNKVKLHKLYAFYLQLGNLPPSRRSKCQSIFLLGLCKSKYVRKYGLSTVLETFITDIKTLETQGITVDINGHAKVFKGSLLSCVADNLAAHAIGGFLESFSALRFCRFCMISKEQLAEVFLGPRRNIVSYNEQCVLVEQNPDLSKIYGLKRKSCLNELQYFHAVDGLPPDITHDVFEGVAKFVLCDVISYCISEDYFTLHDLNESIEQFPYSACDRANKPCILSSPNDIKQTAAQTWCLLRLLPLLVGENVPHNIAQWEVLLNFLDVVEFSCMRDIRHGQVLFMGELIEQFSNSYQTAFPEVGIKPKLHFIHHYSEQTLKFGPLVHSWSIRFEAKHNWFKQTLKTSKCFKNIEKTLARRHQHMLSTYGVNQAFFDKSCHEIKGGKVVNINLFTEEAQNAIKVTVGNVTQIFQAKQILVYDNILASACVVPYSENGDLINFKEVKHCLMFEGEPYFLCQELVTKAFVRHYHAYKVERRTEFFMLKLTDLLCVHNFHSLGLYSVAENVGNHNLYVVLKMRLLMPEHP